MVGICRRGILGKLLVGLKDTEILEEGRKIAGFLHWKTA